MFKESARLLEAWREAERAAEAAKIAADHAQEAAEAAARAAEAARQVAEDAGLSLDAAGRVVSGAKKAFKNHEAEIVEEDRKQAREAPPGSIGEPG